MHIKILLVCSFLLVGQGILSAQTRGGGSPQDDLDYYNQDRGNYNQGGGIWYGGGFLLGFNSNGQESLFAVGVSPILGYKVTPALSFGPRGSLSYNVLNVNGLDGSINYFIYSAGVFGRLKVFQQFFAHAEYNLENDVIGVNLTAEEPIRRTRGVPYVGAGFSQGGGFQGGVGFELMILFPVREREFFGEPPYIIRSGINVNF
ncbi:MAG: hypothetical protein AAF741_11085 [Bacteroidota bacterium]